MPILPGTPVGLTPKVARIHWNDVLHEFRLKITFQLVTPFGALPEVEQEFTLSDLTSILNTIKNIWAITTSEGLAVGDYVTAPIGDFAVLSPLPTGMALRDVVIEALPTPYSETPEGPDTIEPYDGVTDSWGQTTP